MQTVNYHTLDDIQRGHGLAEYLDAVRCIQMYDFTICTHVILNLPGDTRRDAIETAKILSALRIPIVKIHSLYMLYFPTGELAGGSFRKNLSRKCRDETAGRAYDAAT